MRRASLKGTHLVFAILTLACTPHGEEEKRKGTLVRT